MKKVFRALSLTMAAMLTMFAPLQTTHGTTMCCAECQMIKKDEEIEVVDEQVEETTL